MIRLTFACPAAHIDDANQLARVVGYGPDDDKTYGEPRYQDAAGNLYAVASGLVVPHFVEVATSPLTEPEWGADMAAAQRAQALAALGQPAAPEHIAAFVGDDVAGALAFLGLTPLPEVDEIIQFEA